MSEKPIRLTLAQRICRPLPPLLAQRLRTVVYPMRRAFEDAYEFEVQAQTGSYFRNATSDFHAYPFSVHGYYDWRNWAVALAVCSPGDHIIEIGANIGTETVGFADIVGKTGRVSAFEPLPNNIESIRQNTMRNDLKQIKVYPLAVGAVCDTVEFALPPDNHASGIGYVISHPTGNDVPKITVQSVTLDSLRQELGASQLIVMDVEGAEIDVLRGAKEYINEFQPVIVLEAASRHLQRAGHSLHVLFDVLMSLSYQPFRISRVGTSEIDLATAPHGNWLCVPVTRRELANTTARMIRRCGVLPFFARLNPITQIRDLR